MTSQVRRALDNYSLKEKSPKEQRTVKRYQITERCKTRQHTSTHLKRVRIDEIKKLGRGVDRDSLGKIREAEERDYGKKE